MFQAFRILFERLGLKCSRGKRSFELGTELHNELMEQAGAEKRGADDLAAELVSAGLRRRREDAWLNGCRGTKEKPYLLSFACTCAGTSVLHCDLGGEGFYSPVEMVHARGFRILTFEIICLYRTVPLSFPEVNCSSFVSRNNSPFLQPTINE
jgi:hypothetical protein